MRKMASSRQKHHPAERSCVREASAAPPAMSSPLGMSVSLLFLPSLSLALFSRVFHMSVSLSFLLILILSPVTPRMFPFVDIFAEKLIRSKRGTVVFISNTDKGMQIELLQRTILINHFSRLYEK
jgi:hypothetical protein